ncbi:MAG: transcriptional repressor [Alphaproteobacteria bacterium]|nr:transcriptional repressor [Alphaproteobacteria bacterium]MBU6472568.1 transcriptional repressor [Alphaproteobacteria bacterium]MDE2011435.1 transcriptional repressor [Alphaproteobacteria bacterium]MDE2071826.1 transcriptional repressor [Alphaproteobacteria bacterium]MDE2350501.1 transcriptional repressor [Alphaproteobacteria bacterium]
MARSAAPKSAENTGRRLRAAGLRPTRQRVALANLLFAQGNRHLTAESLHAEVDKAGIDVSLATVYNTLHQFTEAGILRHVSVDASRFYFDTNIDPHQHFYDQGTGTLIDIPSGDITIAGLPSPPKDTVIDGVNVVIRIRPAVQVTSALQSAGAGHISVK